MSARLEHEFREDWESAGGASRLNSQIIDQIYKSIVIVDIDAVSGLNAAQLGDYLAMVSLTQLDQEFARWTTGEADEGYYHPLMLPQGFKYLSFGWTGSNRTWSRYTWPHDCA